MKSSKSIVLACMVAVCVIAISANAEVFQPDPVNLNNLNLTKYYAWKIDFSLPGGETITSASLLFENMRNSVNTNVLYVSLIDGSGFTPNISANVYEGVDSGGGGDDSQNFSGVLPLVIYAGLSMDPTDQTYKFSSHQIYMLNMHVSDYGNFGISFDPDLGGDYVNDGIKLTIETTPVPVPGAVLLGMIGMGVAGIKLRKHA